MRSQAAACKMPFVSRLERAEASGVPIDGIFWPLLRGAGTAGRSCTLPGPVVAGKVPPALLVVDNEQPLSFGALADDKKHL